VLQYTRLERLDRDKHSSILSPFASFKESEATRKWAQDFILLRNFEIKLLALFVSYSNGKQSAVNKSLDGSMYPGLKLAHSALGKKIIIVKNATAYTWDWYCHLVVDRASLKN
jgi:hypothetical protein